MRTQSKPRAALLALAGLFAAGAFAFIAGCTTGGATGTSIDAGPATVPISFEAGSTTNLGVPVQNTGKFDAVAPQNGSFNWTLSNPSESAVSNGTIDCDPANSVAGHCYTTNSAELTGVPGYSVEIAFTYAAGGTIIGLTPSSLAASSCTSGHYCIQCTVTAGSTFGASCTGTVPANDIASSDSAKLVAKTRDFFSSNAGTNVSALRFVTYRDPGDFDVANGTVTYSPDTTGSPSSADNLTEDTNIVATDTDLSDDPTVDSFGDIASAAIAYDIADTNNPMAVYVSTGFTLDLNNTAQRYRNLNFVGMICSSQGASCPDPRSELPATFKSLGHAVNNQPATKLSAATVNGAKFAVMKTSTNNAMLKLYNANTVTWDEVTSFTAAVPDTIDEIQFDANPVTGVVTVMYTKASDKTAVVMQSSDGKAWATLGAIAVPMSNISVATDSAGTVYVSYMDANSVAHVAAYDSNRGLFVELGTTGVSDLASATAAAGITSVTSISNVTVDKMSGTPYVSVAGTKDSGASVLAVFKFDNQNLAWTEVGSVATTAVEMSMAAASGVVSDHNVSLVGVTWTDTNGGIHVASVDGNGVTEFAGLSSYTAVDAANRPSLSFNLSAHTGYLAVKDSNGALKILSVDGRVTELGTVESSDVTANASVTYDAFNAALDVVYFDGTFNEVFAKEMFIGFTKLRITNGG